MEIRLPFWLYLVLALGGGILILTGVTLLQVIGVGCLGAALLAPIFALPYRGAEAARAQGGQDGSAGSSEPPESVGVPETPSQEQITASDDSSLTRSEGNATKSFVGTRAIPPTTFAIFGAGVVSQATGRGFSAHGHNVRFVDADPNVIRDLNRNGLAASFPGEIDWPAVEIAMLAVPTPVVDGRVDLDRFLWAAQVVAEGWSNSDRRHLLVVRSTVPPGTTVEHVKPLLERFTGRPIGPHLGLCVNPDFLRKASAYEDFMNPWVTVVGANDDASKGRLSELYAAFGGDKPIMGTDCTTAEMIRYAHNLYNATKISFFNELYLVAKRLGVDMETVGETVALSAEGMWNPAYGTRAGLPFGGDFLPNDLAAFIEFSRSLDGVETPLLSGTMRANELMKHFAQAPASMQEVVNPDILAAAALETGRHAWHVIQGGAAAS